ncbi:hypothetical protein BFP72_13325 [Reichenbachiella sp. 5M10]|uniref:hypothetical protein n=1 Tax=Reichenbachiella sp. 5M10 TaxID=1889772 RepID=UPI000C157C61|nr:hypothetical protein [Reichenbachiella sp. 5M10]PIB36304.1 hypothetical protein BFP72_13325 [Reichenbachiella sp. 5M10]
MKSHYILFILALLLGACRKTDQTTSTDEAMIEDINDPVNGFNIEESDPTAVFIADKVMTAMGGRKAWDETRYIQWHVGNNRYTWAKYIDSLRIDILPNNDVILMDLKKKTGKAKIDQQEVNNPDSLAKYLTQANETWNTDSYALFMPYKLKDNGVTLYYLGEETTGDGRDAQKIQIEFTNALPLYDIWVDAETNLISQTAYYPTTSYPEPTDTLIWNDYHRYGKILLSTDGASHPISDIRTLTNVPSGTFTTL